MKKIDLRSVHILIVEDDQNYAKNLKKLLFKLDIEQVKIANSYQKALDLFKKYSFDLFIVDINLGENEVRGDEFSRKVRQVDKAVPIIYLTSFFTEENYELVEDTSPDSFLDKSINSLELRQAVELGINNVVSSDLKASNLSDFSSDKFFFKIGNIYKSISPNEITYFFSENKTTYAKVDNRKYPTTSTLKDLEKNLETEGFLRIHKTFLVNVNRIDHIDLQNDGVHIKQEILPIGYAYRKIFLARINLFK